MKKLAFALSALVLAAGSAHAESNISTVASGTATVTANLDFRVVIPRVLYLRVGTGTNAALNSTIDTIEFAPTAASLGTGVLGTPASYTAGTGGDLSAGAVTVRLYGNAGAIALTSVTNGFMTTGTTGETIPWSEIVVVPTALAATTPSYTNGTLAHPTFRTSNDAGAGSTVTLGSATNKIVRQEARWTYSYANTTVPAAGTYGAATPGANNGRVTYTASTP